MRRKTLCSPIWSCCFCCCWVMSPLEYWPIILQKAKFYSESVRAYSLLERQAPSSGCHHPTLLFQVKLVQERVLLYKAVGQHSLGPAHLSRERGHHSDLVTSSRSVNLPAPQWESGPFSRVWRDGSLNWCWKAPHIVPEPQWALLHYWLL